MKIYVLTVSRVFPMTHKMKGKETYFVEKILAGIEDFAEFKHGIPITKAEYNFQVYTNTIPKLHTIRTNYPLWAKRIKEIQEGKAILSIRYWSGKPYNSKQIEICQLDKDSGIGLQKLLFMQSDFNFPKVDDNFNCFWVQNGDLAKNDGLSYEDFMEWFKNYDLSEPMAIIHFTPFRY